MPRSNGRATIKAVSPKSVSKTPLAPTFEALGAFLKDQLNVWGTVAREAGLQAH